LHVSAVIMRVLDITDTFNVTLYLFGQAFTFRSKWPYNEICVCLVRISISPFLQATKALRESRVIALLCFLDFCTRRGEGSASHPGRFLPPGKTRYPLYRRLGGPQGRSGQVRKISPSPGFDPRTVQSVASHYTDWDTRPTVANVCSINRVTLNVRDILTHNKKVWAKL
jgi:hypothetical protein